MKFSVGLGGKTIHTFLRECGYAPEGHAETPGEFKFRRFLGGNRYPKFHIYATQENGKAILNLHLDQRQPSYKGAHAHNAEYEGPAVEAEAARITNLGA